MEDKPQGHLLFLMFQTRTITSTSELKSSHLLAFCQSCVSQHHVYQHHVSFHQWPWSPTAVSDFRLWILHTCKVLTVEEGFFFSTLPAWLSWLLFLLMCLSQSAQAVLLAWALPAWWDLAQTQGIQLLQLWCQDTREHFTVLCSLGVCIANMFIAHCAVTTCGTEIHSC